MFSLWFSHDFPVFLVHDCSIFPGFLVPPQRSSRLAARRAFRCRRVWAAAVRSGTQYLRTVLGDARSEAGGDRRGPEGPGGEGISSEFHYNVGPPFGIAFSWFITPISLWFMVLIVSYSWGTYNELVNGVYKPTYNWGPHIAGKLMIFAGIVLPESYWLVVWNIFMFPYIGNFIIPTYELHHFSEGLKSTSRQDISY